MSASENKHVVMKAWRLLKQKLKAAKGKIKIENTTLWCWEAIQNILDWWTYATANCGLIESIWAVILSGAFGISFRRIF